MLLLREIMYVKTWYNYSPKISAFIKWSLKQFVLKKFGSPAEYACTEANIYGALAELAKKERLHRLVFVNKDGEAVRRIKSKGIRTPYMMIPENKPAAPGVWITFLDEVLNQKDTFVTGFIRNPLICEDPKFLASIKTVKVSLIFSFHFI